MLYPNSAKYLTLILIILPLICSAPKAFSQSDTTSDTAQVKPGETFSDSLVRLSLNLFTSNQRIDLAGKDNLILQDFSGLVRPFRIFDLTSAGSLSQPRYVSLFGIPSANFGYYSDNFFFNPSGLSFPSDHRTDLNFVGLENIASVQLVENPLVNLILADSRIGGFYLPEKAYTGGKPYSRLTFEHGMRGYRRTQVELGRGYRQKWRLYGTLGISKSDGELTNSEQDLDRYGFKLSYDFNPRTTLEGGLKIFSGKRDLTPFPGWEAESLRLKQASQSFYLNFNGQLPKEPFGGTRYNIGLDFLRMKNELKFMGLENLEKVYGLRIEFSPPTMGRNTTRLNWNSYRYDFKARTSHWLQKDNFGFTNLLQVSSKLWWLAWGDFEGIDSTSDFVIDRKFSALTGLALQPGQSWRFYASGGRINTYPTLKQTYSPLRTLAVDDTLPNYAELGNLNLRDGYFWYFQPGIDYESESAKIGAYYFLANSKREVVVARIDSLTYGTWQPVQTDFRTSGVNAYLQIKLADFIGLSLNYCNKSWDKGGQPPYLPRNSAFAALELNKEFFRRQLGWKIRLEGEYLGKRKDELSASLDQAAVLNGKLSLRILAVNFYFVAENLTDEKYRSGSQFLMPGWSHWWGLYWEFFD